MGSVQNSPRVFVSYAWEGGPSSPYREWVGTLCSRLRDDGIDVRLDRWHQADRTFVQFMNAEVREADRVLILCSPEYREKVHASESSGAASGSGWEAMLIGSAMIYAKGAAKITLALALGDWLSAAPDFLLAFPHVDLRSIDGYEASYLDLLRRLHGVTEPAPHLRKPPADLLLSPLPPARLPYNALGATPRHHHASAQLRDALQRRARLRSLSASTKEVEAEILGLKRQLREGGRLPAGDCLGDRFVLTEQLGEGGYATVWRASDLRRGEDVAIKVLHSNLAGNLSALERFRRGARIMAELDHPNIVKIMDHGCEDAGWHYFVMECLKGGDLSREAATDTIDRNRVFERILSVADALVYTHACGHVHRDVKPANILLAADGTPKLSDFDLVLAHDTTGGTRSGALGTFIYAAPESLSRPQGVDVRADVYGLAMTLLYCLHGKQLPLHVVRSLTPVLDEMQAPAPLREVLERALSWDLGHRYPDIAAFREALVECRSAIERGDGAVVSTPAPRSLPEATAVPRNTARAVVADVPISPDPGSTEVARARHQRKIWLISASLGVSLAIGVTLSTRKQRDDAVAAELTIPAAVSLNSVAPAAPPPSATSSAVVPPKRLRQVVIAATPPEAQIFRDGAELGIGPVMIEVEDGSPSNLEFRADGYTTLKMAVDGTKARISAKLVRKQVAAPPAPKPVAQKATVRPASKRAAPRDSEVVNPWQ